MFRMILIALLFAAPAAAETPQKKQHPNWPMLGFSTIVDNWAFRTRVVFRKTCYPDPNDIECDKMARAAHALLREYIDLLKQSAAKQPKPGRSNPRN